MTTLTAIRGHGSDGFKPERVRLFEVGHDFRFRDWDRKIWIDSNINLSFVRFTGSLHSRVTGERNMKNDRHVARSWQ